MPTNRPQSAHQNTGQTLASRQCMLMSHALRDGTATKEDFYSLLITLSAAYAVKTDGGFLFREFNALSNGNPELGKPKLRIRSGKASTK